MRKKTKKTKKKKNKAPIISTEKPVHNMSDVMVIMSPWIEYRSITTGVGEGIQLVGVILVSSALAMIMILMLIVK